MRYSLILICVALFPTLLQSADNLPQFRGPTGQGHYPVNRAPLQWSEAADNVAWKVEIDGLGWSSPVVADGQIWLTTATDEGRSLRVLALDIDSGKERLNSEVFHREEAGTIHAKNSHASPTPIIAGDRVFVHFGTYGTACLATSGSVVWRREIEYKHVHGPGGSPELVDNVLVISCDGGDRQFVVGLDANSGQTLWQTERPENPHAKKFAFSTPLAIEEGGANQVVSPGAGGVSSYDPHSGREIWRVDYPEGYSVIPRPVRGLGMVFVSSSFDKPRLLAIRTDGAGNVTESHVAWKLDRGAPHSASALLVDRELYIVSDRGVAACLDAATGEVHWQERLGGNFSASPLLAAGRIYFQNEQGETTIILPGKQYQELAKNELPGRTLATPTPIEGALLVRTETALYRINAERE
ncbi:MAG: PQQ-binding-like beta-propeller repeat protein [Planctomycetales bacterium]|nr:PQQ-binding-like beta-propeller repeat protein [Planctomycetales bacterium]